MKILYLIHSFPVASETFIMREVAALRRLGAEVEVLSFDRPSSADAARLDDQGRRHLERTFHLPKYPLGAAALGWLRHGLGTVGRLNRKLSRAATVKTHPGLRLARAQAAAEFARRGGFSRLHAHWPYASQVGLLVQRMTGLPLSVSIHAHEVEHDFGHFEELFEELAFATFCNAAAMERLLARLPPAARKRAHLVYHGVDLDRFAPLPFPSESTPLRVLSAGRFARSKGFDRLIRGCARYQSAGGAVELTLLGHGPLAGEFTQLAHELNFAEHLHLPGWLPHDQVAARLGQSHVFALMADTNFHDGLPNVVLEAMASARPVILSPFPAAGEAVAQGVEGFILPSPEADTAFANALRQCADSGEYLLEMGRAARRRMENAFDENVHARRLLELFEQAPRRYSDLSRILREAA